MYTHTHTELRQAGVPTLDHMSGLPRGLTKARLVAPLPELLIQEAWAGALEFTFRGAPMMFMPMVQATGCRLMRKANYNRGNRMWCFHVPYKCIEKVLKDKPENVNNDYVQVSRLWVC